MNDKNLIKHAMELAKQLNLGRSEKYADLIFMLVQRFEELIPDKEPTSIVWEPKNMKTKEKERVMSDYIDYKVRVYKDGTKEWRWYLNDELHREDGPAVEYASGDKRWYLDGKLHREDGPAIEWANGDKWWYLNDELHREDGPAMEYANGNKSWYLKGKLHREDGPTVAYVDSGKDWYLNGNYSTEADHKAEMVKRNNTCDGKIVTIEGKEYKLTEVK
jgi:hypothetical protein